jgi:hypothetical protein
MDRNASCVLWRVTKENRVGSKPELTFKKYNNTDINQFIQVPGILKKFYTILHSYYTEKGNVFMLRFIDECKEHGHLGHHCICDSCIELYNRVLCGSTGESFYIVDAKSKSYTKVKKPVTTSCSDKPMSTCDKILALHKGIHDVKLKKDIKDSHSSDLIDKMMEKLSLNEQFDIITKFE